MATPYTIDRFTILWILLFALFLYVAKDYPSWRKKRSLNPTASSSTDVAPTTSTSLSAGAAPTASTSFPTDAAPTASTTQPPQKVSEPHKLWLIPCLPFIILYLIVRAALDLFRLGVFILLQAIEWTGVMLAKFALYAVTESLSRTIEALAVWLHDHSLPTLWFLGQKLHEYSMLALVRVCEGTFYWTVFCWAVVFCVRAVCAVMFCVRAVVFCVRAAAWVWSVGTRLHRFWVDIGKPWSAKILAGAKIWVLDLLIWVVTRGVYLMLVLYEASTLLTVAIWSDVMGLDPFIAKVAAMVAKVTVRLVKVTAKVTARVARVTARVLEPALAPTGTYIASKITQAWILTTVQVRRMAWFALDGILIPAIKQSWRVLIGPTMQRLVFALYNHLISELTQRFLIGLGKRLAAAAIFWCQKSIRTAIFFVGWVQLMYPKTLAAWYWTYTHVVLPLSYLLPDTYRRLSFASARIYIHLTSTLFVFNTCLITFLRPFLDSRNHLIRQAIFLVTALITHVRPILVRLLVATMSLAASCCALLVDRIGPAYAYIVIISARVAEIALSVLARTAEEAGQVYELVAPEMTKAREQLAKKADQVVELIAANLMEWVKRETAKQSVSKGEKEKAE